MPLLLPPLEAYQLWSATWADDPSPIVALESRWLAPMLSLVAGRCFVDPGRLQPPRCQVRSP